MLLWSRGEQKVKEVVIDRVIHTQDKELLSFQELVVLFWFLATQLFFFLVTDLFTPLTFSEAI